MARLDTGWHVNPKVLGVGLQAMGLHAWSISYCDHALTDGFIPAGSWPSLPGAGAAVRALLTAGLWERSDNGFRLHDYTDYNRTRAQVQTQRKEDRVRKMSGRTNHRNGTGLAAESGGNPRAPGPGPGINTAAAAAGTPDRGLGETKPRDLHEILDHLPAALEAAQDERRRRRLQDSSEATTSA